MHLSLGQHEANLTTNILGNTANVFGNTVWQSGFQQIFNLVKNLILATKLKHVEDMANMKYRLPLHKYYCTYMAQRLGGINARQYIATAVTTVTAVTAVTMILS